MKKRIIIICAVFTTAILTVYGCVNKDKKINTSNIEPAVLATVDQRTGKTIFYGIENYNEFSIQNERYFAYSVRGKYNNSVTLEKLQKANSINDLIPNYPSSWIDSYISVEIIATINGKELKAESKDDILSEEQKQLFNSSDRISDIVLNSKYRNRNTVTNVLENREMNYAMSVIPDVEATYIGGYNKMISYLKEKSFEEVLKTTTDKIDAASISFTISENGAAENVVLLESSGHTELDNVMLKLINDMPKWKPAKNSNNEVVKQEFLFNIGLDAC